MIILPIYPKTVNSYVYSVNLWNYTETAIYNRFIYWILFLSLMVTGVGKIVQIWCKIEKGNKFSTFFSVILSMAALLYLVWAREVYAATIVALLLFIKVLLIFKRGI